MYFVYALIDPRTQVVGYIGITDNPNERLQSHLSSSAQKNKTVWIEQLRLEGLGVKMVILEVVDTKAEAQERERFLINQYAEQGSPLTNIHHLKNTLIPRTVPPQNDYPTVQPIDFYLLGGFMILLEWKINDRDQNFQRVLSSWLETNNHIGWLVGRPLDPAQLEDKWSAFGDVWGSLLLLPLEDNLIFRLLQNDVKLYDVQEKDILTFEVGKHYSCYVASVTYKPEKAQYLSKLLEYSLLDLCSLGIYVDRLYTSVTRGIEMTPLKRLVKEHFFGIERKDVSENVMLLDLNEHNFSATIQRYQQCQLKGRKHIHQITVHPIIPSFGDF